MTEQNKRMVPAITVNELERKLRILKEYLEKERELARLTSDGIPTFGDKMTAAYIETLAVAAGDKAEWIEWYIYECQFGKHPLEASWGKTKIKVNSVSKLMRVIRGE